jgi:ferredoxin--NADP+ reductase
MRKKPTGTLVNDALIGGKRLYMLSTGTGFAPFASLIREPETYEKFDEVILTHTCRDVAELKYGIDLVEAVKQDELVGEEASKQLTLVTATTREEYPTMGRITTRIEDGSLFDGLGVPRLNPEEDRVMICGSMDMLKDCKALCESHGLTEGANNNPAEFVVERAFVD